MKLWRLFTWAVMNGLFAWCMWLALVEASEGARNVLIFVTWLYGVLCWVAVSDGDIRKNVKKKGRVIPAALSHGVGLAYIVVLIWHGWWWTGIAWTMIEACEATIYGNGGES